MPMMDCFYLYVFYGYLLRLVFFQCCFLHGGFFLVPFFSQKMPLNDQGTVCLWTTTQVLETSLMASL